jgi:quercetin 2,3-dioxygenase
MKTSILNESAENKTVLLRRSSEERGITELGWLHSRHTFSFGSYFDPDHMGFRALRVINDDVVEPGQGFGEHPHRDAEIFSYVLEGELQHKDSMGNGRVIKAGDLQYISAGSGVLHSEFKPSRRNRVHFLQVWLRPNVSGGAPRYAEKSLGKDAKPNGLTLLFAGEPRDQAVEIRASGDVYLGRLDAGRQLIHRPALGRGQWVHVIAGALRVCGESLTAGDGLAIEHAAKLEFGSGENSQFLLFDLN